VFAKVVADRWARAVLQTCPDLATIERVKDELTVLGEAYTSSKETRSFLQNPKMPASIKNQILENALSKSMSPEVMRLLNLLLMKRRQNILPEIAERFSNLTDQFRGVEHAEITTAVSITPDLEKSLHDAVQRFSTRQVETSFRIDPLILGGVQIRLGDNVVDGSLRHRFEEIRRTMLAARVPRSKAQES
jgi:F-type H+-transporting ATPase subunit delta